MRLFSNARFMLNTRGIVAALRYLLLALAVSSAHADPFDIRIEAGYGMCRAHTPPENMWHQNDLPNRLQMRDRCGEFGASIATPIRYLRFVARYANLGRFATHAVAIADDNDDFTRRGLVGCTQEQAAKGFHADCKYNWNGSGDAKGVLFAGAFELFKIGPLRLGTEAGVFVYRATWREIVSPIDCPNNQCWQMQIDQRTGWQRTPEVALTARWDMLYAAVRRYDVPNHAPITSGFRAPIYQFVLGLSVPL